MGLEYGAGTQIGNEIALTSHMRNMSPAAYLLAMHMAHEDDHEDDETIVLTPLDIDQQKLVDEQVAFRDAAVAGFRNLVASGAQPCACGWRALSACGGQGGCMDGSASPKGTPAA